MFEPHTGRAPRQLTPRGDWSGLESRAVRRPGISAFTSGTLRGLILCSNKSPKKNDDRVGRREMISFRTSLSRRRARRAPPFWPRGAEESR